MIPKISVIVPVYNVEKYVGNCIESILNQSFEDFELLLIDDGSKDESGRICDDFCRIDSRVKVYHIENGGVSKARNYGIKEAKSDWITFIDSDDYIGKDFLKNLFSPTKDNEIEFVQGGCINCTEKGEILDIEQRYERYVSENKMALLESFRGLTFSKLFKSSIIKRWEIHFDYRVHLGEDMIFTLEYLTHIRKFAFVEENTYYYRRHNNSASNTYRMHYDEALYTYNRRKEALIQFKETSNIKICSIRENQLSHILFDLITILYYDNICRENRLKRMRKDLDKSDYELFKYYKDSNKLKLILAKFLYRRYIKIFDIIAYSFYFTKLKITNRIR